MDAKKKTLFAASLMILWAGLVVWQWRLLQEPVRVPLTNVTGHQTVGRLADIRRAGLHVNLDLLVSSSLQRQVTFTAPRNIFSVPRSDGMFADGSVPTSVNQPASDSAGILTPQEDRVELEQYRYLGFLRAGEERRKTIEIAILRRDDEVLMLKVGDRVDHHLILKAINSESVTIHDTGTRTDQTVLLSEESSEEPSGQE